MNPAELKQARRLLEEWLAKGADHPTPEVCDALLALTVEELILPTTPEGKDELETFYRSLRAHGAAREGDLRRELKVRIRAAGADATRQLLLGTQDWLGKNARRSTIPEYADRLLIACGDQLAALILFQNLTQAVADGEHELPWFGATLQRTAAAKLAPKLWTPVTEDKVQVCCNAVVKYAPRFQWKGELKKAITFFQNSAWWEWKQHTGAPATEMLEDHHHPHMDGPSPAGEPHEEPEAVLHRDRKKLRLWNHLQTIRSPEKRLRFYALAVAREHRQPPTEWNAVAEALPQLHESNVLLHDHEVPRKTSRQEIAAAFAGMTNTMRSLQKEYLRTREALRPAKNSVSP